MHYSVRHVTTYRYSQPTPVCRNIVHLAPRATPHQNPRRFELTIRPAPAQVFEHRDYFGNTSHQFAISEAHRVLQITAESDVEVTPPGPLDPASAPTCAEVAALARESVRDQGMDVYLFTLPSARVELSPQLAEYASAAPTEGRTVLQVAAELTERIHADFKFDPRATTVSTPLADVLAIRRGVCQDFAHLAIGCLRALGAPARYVSGYVRTQPPPGQARLIGADASHAWLGVWCGPALGWVDFDPTNNSCPTDGHITVAWGRDYDDTCPVQGVLIGGGDYSLHVGVDVVPQEENGQAEHGPAGPPVAVGAQQQQQAQQ